MAWPGDAMDSAAAFLAQSREYLTAHYLPKIQAALESLDDRALWWRPNPASNAAGNLILHLAGNVRQWIVSGVGGAPDRRDRPAEFAADRSPGRSELLAALTEAVLDADAVLARTDPASLSERRRIQGRDVTVLHFGMHTGQIIYLAKQISGRDLGFYVMEEGIPRAAWKGRPEGGSA